MKRQIFTKIELFLKENASVDKDGNLINMNWDPSSDDLWSDDEFIKIVNDGLEYADEMPEKMYVMLSDNHKKLYRKELLSYGGQIVSHSINQSLIKDLIKYDYEQLYKEVIAWIELFPKMGDNSFPTSSIFIKMIDENFQEKIIKKLIYLMRWGINIDLETYNSFTDNVKYLINEYEFDIFIILDEK